LYHGSVAAAWRPLSASSNLVGSRPYSPVMSGPT
jgi:hypothetical protein